MLFPKVATVFASILAIVCARTEPSTSSNMNFPDGPLLHTSGRNIHSNNSINLAYNDIETLRADVQSQRRSLATAIWKQMGTDLDGTAPGDQFGFSLALSDDGTTLAVGAFYKDGIGTTGSNLVDSGEVRVFRFINNQWVQFGPQIQGEGAGDQFGTGVALSRDGNTMVVGGINSSNFNGVSTGHVRMFKLIQSGQFLIWKKVSPDIDGYAAGDEFGRGVAISDDGNIVAIGAPFVDSINGMDSGRVVVYRYVETSSVTGFFPMGSQLNGKGAGNYFGYSVSLSGDGLRLAAGAYKSDGTSGVDSGTIRAFRFLNDAWIPLGDDIHGEMKGDQLGMSIAMSKSGLVIASGAPLNDGNGVNSGSVRTYKFDGYNWQKLGEDIDGSAAGDAFGVSVALAREGTVLAIGGFLNESGTGYVRIYEYNSITKNWIPYGPEIEGSSPNTLFGRSVGMSEDGNILAVGGPWNSGSGGQTSGLVRVYTISSDSSTQPPTSSPTTENFLFQNGTWKPFGLPIVSSYSGSEYGNAVSVSRDGQTIAVGAPMIDCASGANCGLVQVYYFQNGAWKKLGGEIKGSAPSGKLGTCVKLSSDAKTLAVGSLQGVSVYEQLNGIWLQIGGIIPGESSGDSFGQSVDISDDGQFIIVGAPFNDGSNGQNSGHARVFRRSNNLWLQIGNDIDGEASWDLSGYSVSMSSDAGILAISAFMNSGNGAFAGHVRTFQWNENDKDWSQIGPDIDGNSAGDQFGSSIAQSASGTVLAVGAPRSNKYGTLSGYVKVLSLSSNNAWIQKGQEIPGETGEGFGAVVSLSDDGNIVAVRSYDSVNFSSQVKIYFFSNGLWERVNGNIGADDSLSMSLAGSGTFVSIGGRSEVKSFQLIYSSHSNAPTKKPSQRPSSSPTISATPTKTEGTKYPSESPSFHPSEEPSSFQVWTQLGNDLVSSEKNVYQYGHSISLVTIEGSSMGHEKILAVGQPQGSNQRGTVYVYKYNSASRLWSPLGNVISGNSTEGRFGTSVKLSADGKILAVGAILAKNLNDVSVGEVSVFEFDSNLSSWSMIGQFFGSNEDDQAGRSVALSVSTEIIDGISTKAVTVAYGIPKSDPSGQLIDGGLVKIFRKLGDAGFEKLGNDLQGTNAKDGFGTSVSLSDDGKILAVGSIGHDLNSASNNVGKVTLYRYAESNTWEKLGNDITGSASGDQAGFSVSLSGNGNVIAIGLPWSDDSDRDNVGLVRLYRQNNNEWTLIKEIRGEGEMDNFGYSVSLDRNGETVVIGAFQNDGVSGENSGHVRVYRQQMNVWKQIGDDIDGVKSGDLFGYSVSVSSDGKYLASSAVLNDDNGPFSGHVRVFEEISSPPTISLPMPPTSVVIPTAPTKMPSSRPTHVPTFEPPPVSTWEPISNSIDGLSTNDYFGWASSLSQDGKVLAVSSPFSDIEGTNSGQVIIYELSSTGAWVQKGLVINGLDSFDRFGSSVDLSADGNIVVVGARDRNTNAGINSGETIVYKYDGVNKPWKIVGQAIAGEGSNDGAGTSVSISDDGNIIAIGAPLNSNNGGTGHARVYGLESGQWKKMGQDLDAMNLGDQFGRSVSLSGDGSKLAVSALGNQNFKGLVRVFKYDSSGVWLPLGSDLVGSESNSYFGATISLSQDGTIVAIGSLSSSTKVFKYANNQWEQMGNEIPFGYTALSLSNDGLTLALSDNLADDQGERVQVYRYINNEWLQMGQSLEGEVDGIWFGLSVSLSGSGNVLAVSSPKYDTLNGGNAGRVQVFYDTTSLFLNSQSSSNFAASVSSGGYRKTFSLFVAYITALAGSLLLYNL